MYLEANSWPSFLIWWIMSSLLGFRARTRNVGGGCCMGFESSILSYLDRLFISSRQSRIKSRELSEPYTQKQPTVEELKGEFSYKRDKNNDWFGKITKLLFTTSLSPLTDDKETKFLMKFQSSKRCKTNYLKQQGVNYKINLLISFSLNMIIDVQCC